MTLDRFTVVRLMKATGTATLDAAVNAILRRAMLAPKV